ncbi:unnamed protein product [Peronospora destructor]|uniref:Uncharacterized protein n=1 Tax=Peronospora destructor TaxID=86335 RepID=A0AAV0TYB5_9STRA|nr:unnamed protein product [Peronospora destructor]
MAKQHQYDSQFELYTSEQLRERWEVLVERAESHMEKIKKLSAYQEKKRLDALRHDRIRRSLTSFLSFHGTTQSNQPRSRRQSDSDDDDLTLLKSSGMGSNGSNSDATRTQDVDVNLHVCSLREEKILELNYKIKLDKFEKHYDSNISEVFRLLTRSVQKLRRHGKHKHTTKFKSKGSDLEQIPEGEAHSDSDHEGFTSETERDSSDCRSSDGQTMWAPTWSDRRYYS